MRFLRALCLGLFATSALAQSTEGIYDLVKRRLPNHVGSFHFSLVNSTSNSSSVKNDAYVVSTTAHGTVHVEGNTLSALSSG